MGYVKVVKNRNYYRRYKVKYRRRRECKTDYGLRRRLIVQDKRKYNAPKWRFIVRVTSTDVTCQVASSKMIGDHILCAAYSHELKRYGLKVGLTNYAACYCTGLLLARRLLKKLSLDKFYPGKKCLDGNKFASHVANVKWKTKFSDQNIHRPFKCLLDIGLARASSGARVFGCLKGAIDGGLDIPHNQKRFPGYVRAKRRKDKDEYHADVHAAKIYGGHVRDYMKKLSEGNPEKFNQHFARYHAAGIGADDLEGLYERVHQNIRKHPESPPKKRVIQKSSRQSKQAQEQEQEQEQEEDGAKSRAKPKKISPAARKVNRFARIQELEDISKAKAQMRI